MKPTEILHKAIREGDLTQFEWALQLGTQSGSSLAIKWDGTALSAVLDRYFHYSLATWSSDHKKVPTYEKMVARLLSAGEKPTKQVVRTLINNLRHGLSSAHTSSFSKEHSHARLVSLLDGAGADWATSHRWWGGTKLFDILLVMCPDILPGLQGGPAYLVNHGLPIHVSRGDYETAFHKADAAMDELLARRHIQERQAHLEASLQDALVASTHAVDLLIHAGADVNFADNKGNTLLMWATTGTGSSSVEKLLATGKVDINAANKDGETALTWALRGNFEASEALVEAGINTMAGNYTRLLRYMTDTDKSAGSWFLSEVNAVAMEHGVSSKEVLGASSALPEAVLDDMGQRYNRWRKVMHAVKYSTADLDYCALVRRTDQKVARGLLDRYTTTSSTALPEEASQVINRDGDREHQLADKVRQRREQRQDEHLANEERQIKSQASTQPSRTNRFLVSQ